MWALRQVPKGDHVSFLRDARDSVLINGSVLRYQQMPNDNCVAHIPFTAFPSPFPARLYRECLDLQPTINKLMMCIANDYEFIHETLGPIASVDGFTRELLAIEDVVRKEGKAQPVMSCISRSDYMLHKTSRAPTNLDDLQVRQVEVNAIASAMSAHSCIIRSTQDFLMQKYNIVNESCTSFPENKSLNLVAESLIDAFNAYGKSNTYILTVTEPISANFSEQMHIEQEVLRKRGDIKFVRRKFNELPTDLRLGPNKELLSEDSKEFAVVYFRYGYDPTNYCFEGSWAVRLLLERSRAVKCPSINFHLSGAKKFQQVLNSEKQLERYLSTIEASRLEKVFCKFWSIEFESGEGYRLATTTGAAKKLVLKPQREGGGHNIFAEDIKPFVQNLTDHKERSQYILMEYIDGPLERNLLLLNDDQPIKDLTNPGSCDQLISELGIYGGLLTDGGSTLLSNRTSGYLIRSKKSGVNEGGVAAGYAGISNLILLPDDMVDLSDYFSD